MKRSLSVALALAASIGIAGVAQAATTPTQFKLSAQNGSGENGTATLLQSGDNVIVRVRVSGAPAGVPQPVHIHKGTCDKLDPKPTYPLRTLVDGFSETTVPNVSLGDLTSGAYAINIHKSTSDIKTYVACGNLKVEHGAT
ncbi:MAG: hypothetical protein WCE44_11980 [Candidatus Velthaea sp.]|jgi:hypothetical protein